MLESTPHSCSSDQYKTEYSGEFLLRWDELIGWRARRKSEGSFFIDLLRAHNARRVLDAATGTGFHAVHLAEQGFSVVAADGAAMMVTQAAENLRSRGVDVPVHVCDWRELHRIVDLPFDAVLCLGNSLSHLFDEGDRAATLKQFHDALTPGGVLIADHRNYDTLLDGTYEAQRQNYCCCGPTTSVKLIVEHPRLVRIEYQVGGDTAHQIGTYPLRRAEMLAALARAGFDDVVTYGDFQQDYDAQRTEFFTYVARKR